MPKNPLRRARQYRFTDEDRAKAAATNKKKKQEILSLRERVKQLEAVAAGGTREAAYGRLLHEALFSDDPDTAVRAAKAYLVETRDDVTDTIQVKRSLLRETWEGKRDAPSDTTD